MVGPVLDEYLIQAGGALVARLDKKLVVRACFWLFQSETSWRLFVATPEVRTLGPKKVYALVQKVLQSNAPSPISLSDVSVIPVSDPLVSLLGSAIRTGKTVGELRLSRTTINGQFVEDAVIYRMNV